MKRWVLVAALAIALPGCDLLVSPDISLGEIPPGGGGSGSVIAFIHTDVTALGVGESGLFTYSTQPEAAVREVVWINEQPGIVSIETPLPSCGTRCARITGLSQGFAQLRPYSMINGGKITAPWIVLVR